MVTAIMTAPKEDGVVLLYITIMMLTLSWIVLLSRLGVRRWINAFGSDDWLMAIGLVSAAQISKQFANEVHSLKPEISAGSILGHGGARDCVLFLRRRAALSCAGTSNHHAWHKGMSALVLKDRRGLMRLAALLYCGIFLCLLYSTNQV